MEKVGARVTNRGEYAVWVGLETVAIAALISLGIYSEISKGTCKTVSRSFRPSFTKSFLPLRMVGSPTGREPARQTLGAYAIMGTSGELIRLINYVDDIVTTLRRINAFIPAMDAEEKKRLAENLRAAGANLNSILATLDKGA
jgi:hypothetical protein